MKISVVIPTYNGARKLPSIINSLLAQTYAPDEILIVVDGSTDNTLDVLKMYEHISTLKIVFQKNSGRAHVRNTGVKESTGALLIFLDDDMRLEKEGIQKHLNFHLTNEKSILFGRAVLDPSKILGDDFSSFRAVSEKKWIGNFKCGLNSISLNNYAFTTQNLSCTKEVYHLIGGFDERLRDSEDFDFSLRAIKLGIPIYFDYDLMAWHDDYVSVNKYIDRQIEYAESKIRLGKLKPDMKLMYPPSFSYGSNNSKLNQALRRVFINNKIWENILKNNFFLKYFPKRIRYKTYDLIISSTVTKKIH